MSDFVTQAELDEITKYYGPIEEMDAEKFRKTKKQLQVKYHPDNFEKFDDETVKEMATERFQRIEVLSSKLELILNKKLSLKSTDDIDDANAIFAFDKMKIEIVTRNKDLKYHLFGTAYRWLNYGDSFKIPETEARIIADESHGGQRMGFVETVRMYLTFGFNDPIELIAVWLFNAINDRASSLIIEGKKVRIDLVEINAAIKRTSFAGIEAPKGGASKENT